ncbi:CPBP family intramembrane metalloprotease [Methanobrevibacter sp. TMH8]|uniref:CPBP family intramembrane glutamic endopeptidase n=1 Tax=Methanobrevibacter sp. TMH8 TaxID=2848611 RepID=UPI001CCBDFFD|nr:CPBP family intramembrane glutamic endopeptidase [Methanobrevibacter sp. TMH8]MBZ9570010.1 CPBP family intramembrane metalloprotease [Methanobrevibacter sp. TMH8]
MLNKFLNNGNEGKNNWWRYLITIILSWGVAEIIAGFTLGFLIASYFIASGNFDINYFINYIMDYESNINLFFIMTFFSFSFSMLFLFFSLKLIHKRDFMSLVNISKKYDEFSGKTINWIKRVRWRQIIKGALIWLVFLIVMLLISIILDPSGFNINFNIGNLYLTILLFILAIPIQVLFEELFFRGYINQGLSLKIKSPIIVILISSFVFSLGHIINGGTDPIFMVSNIVITFMMGMIFSVATLATNGIEWAVGAHLINNFFAFIISSSEGSFGSFETIIQSTNLTDPLIDFIFSVIALLIFAIILFFYKKEKILKGLDTKHNL